MDTQELPLVEEEEVERLELKWRGGLEDEFWNLKPPAPTLPTCMHVAVPGYTYTCRT